MDTDFWSQIFGFSNYGELLWLVKNSILAGALLGVVGGLIGTFVMMRDLAFAVHGVSELSFAGASAALLFGVNVVVGSIAGSLIAAILIGILGARARERNSIIAVLLVIWRPLTFASVDEQVAEARGVPVRMLSLVFMVLLGLATAVSLQIVGALLVLALLVTPAAAAMRVTSSPLLTPILSVIFAVVSVVGGILLALGGGLPISPYVTTISFLIYLVCRVIGSRRQRAGLTGRQLVAQAAE